MPNLPTLIFLGIFTSLLIALEDFVFSGIPQRLLKMRLKTYFPVLILTLLVSLLAGMVSFPASAQGDVEQVIQISPNGQGRAHVVTYSPDGKILAVGSSLGIHLFNSSDLQLLRFTGTETWVRALAFSPDGSMLASGSYDNIVRLWRVSDGTLLKELTGHAAWVRSLAFSADGQWLATGSDDDTVRLWSMPGGDPFLELDSSVQGVRALAFSPDGAILATGGFDKVIRFWNTSNGTLVRELKGHADWVRALAFSPDGEWLASGAFDATVRLWRVTDGELIATREEHASSVLGVAFSPDGSLLASASVDTTVRLWKMPALEPYDLLRNHTDFVYSVAFAPDGKSLVSGAVDNTIRSWIVREQKSSTAEELVSTPSNCKACHHPRGNFLQPGGNSQPPRVMDVACTTCHEGGSLALNWCPAFPRSSMASGLFAVSPATSGKVGVPRGNQDLSVVISIPGNRAYYLLPNIISPLPIAGQVYSARDDVVDVEVKLEVWSGADKIATYITQPRSDGQFHFNTFFGKKDTQIKMPMEQRICGACHNDNVDEELLILSGEIHIIVTAVTPGGKQAMDERWIHVDRSSSIISTVSVRDGLTGQPVAGLEVQASTVFYDWRDRINTGITDINGIASIPIEVSSETFTNHTFQVLPSNLHGVEYKSVEPVIVTIPPGATGIPEVSLTVQSNTGKISGQIIGVDFPIQIKAITLPNGSVHVTTTSAQGVFGFADLPVGRYMVVADAHALAERGLAARSKIVDLSQSLSEVLNLIPQPLEGSVLQGSITDENGISLPFAWAGVGNRIERTDPGSGVYAIYGLPLNETTAIVNAPGYFSQAQLFSPAPDNDSSLNFMLVRRPETKILPWGEGTIVIPPETVFSVKEHLVNFEQGWLWGTGESAQPFVIQWGDIQITIPAGRFALERQPAQAAWLYVFTGEATIQQGDANSPVIVQAGEMIYLDAKHEVQPIPYDSVVISALHAGETPGSNPVWQPSFSAQIRDRLAQAGINTAQLMTFVTYLLALLILCVIPIIIGTLFIKNRREGKHDRATH